MSEAEWNDAEQPFNGEIKYSAVELQSEGWHLEPISQKHCQVNQIDQFNQ